MSIENDIVPMAVISHDAMTLLQIMALQRSTAKLCLWPHSLQQLVETQVRL